MRKNLKQKLLYLHSFYSMDTLDFSMLLCFCYTSGKVSRYGVFSHPYFPVFGLNTDRCFVPFRIQSECGKIGTRKNSVFGQFSRSVGFMEEVLVNQKVFQLTLLRLSFWEFLLLFFGG